MYIFPVGYSPIVYLSLLGQDGVEPNEVSYATVIHGHAKKGEIASAKGLLRKMIQSGTAPKVEPKKESIAGPKKGSISRAI